MNLDPVLVEIIKMVKLSAKYEISNRQGECVTFVRCFSDGEKWEVVRVCNYSFSSFISVSMCDSWQPDKFKFPLADPSSIQNAAAKIQETLDGRIL